MNRLRCSAMALCVVFLLCLPASAHADQQADDLYQKYKAAKAKGQYDVAGKYVCDAAKIDTKYQDECDRVSTYVNGRLRDFQTSFDLGKAEYDRGDYISAKRDLANVLYGPNREPAQSLSAKAQEKLDHPAPPPPVADPSADALKAAQLAYANNNFPTALVNAEQVRSAELLPQALTIRTNIKSYTDAMQQGNDLMRKKNYSAAKAQYEIAAHIKSDGPENPLDKLRTIAALIAPANIPPVDDWKTVLAKAQWDAARGNCDTALVSYAHVLELKPGQPDAKAGQSACQQIIVKTDPTALEKMLANGVHDFYDSNFSRASDAISVYLTGTGIRSKGAAYFYLGAAMLSQAFLASPKDKKESDHLRQSAMDNFRQAKQENFKPSEKYVSPKILAVWTQAGM